MVNRIKSPLRLDSVLIAISLLLLFLYFGRGILVPIALAVFFAILLRPIVTFLQTKVRTPLFLAVSIAVIFGIFVVAGVVYFISFQVSDMANDWEKIQSNLLIHYNHFQFWIKDSFDISFRDQNKYLQQAQKDSLESGKSMISTTINTFSCTLLNLVLVPFYTLLILLNRNLYIVFFLKLFRNEPETRIHKTLVQIKGAVLGFLFGTFIEMIIVSGLTSIGLLVIGMKYAILLGVITGVLNLIPYIGIVVAMLITVVATLTNSADLSTIAGVVIVNVAVQLIDNNILVPMVVSSKVKVNSLMSIIFILIGGALWGIAGMFLAIPSAAILKIIFDEVPYLQPWGFLIGDMVPATIERNPELHPNPETNSKPKFGFGFAKPLKGLVKWLRKSLSLNK